MWRRVASQSPTSLSDSAEASEYLNAWTALGKLLASGRSLSGRERNCCFLNLGGSTFADVSAVSGFDFPDDARGLAVVDWDADGDLDLWLSNRTAPRVRFLKNGHASGNRFLSLKLQGSNCNRDAIGARVELRTGPESSTRLVRALRAGEGYLSQSDKWLHFGLDEQDSPIVAVVRWPDGRKETFQGLQSNQHYLLVQGSGRARNIDRNRKVELAASSPNIPKAAPEKRIVLPARLPLPKLEYETFDGQVATMEDDNRPVLVNLWATWCQPCLKEIAEWSARASEFDKLGVRVVLLSVDKIDQTENEVGVEQIQKLLTQLKSPFPSGLATDETLYRLNVSQQVLTKRIRSLPVPSSFLLDANGHLSVLYKGGVEFETLLTDMAALPRPADTHRDLAVPFPGRWYTNPFPPDLMAVPTAFLDQNQPALALDYLDNNLLALIDAATSRGESLDDVANFFVSLGLKFQELGDAPRVISALQSATKVQPSHFRARMALAMIYQQTNRMPNAVEQYRALHSIRPTDPMIANNLAWMLATSSDASVRSPREAIRLAETVCQQSKRQVPSALDTLAAAYAAAGDFDRARSIIREAIQLVEKQGKDDLRQKFNQRLQLYQKSQPLVE